MDKVRFGCALDGGSAAQATIREVRLGTSQEPPYSYHTLDLDELIPSAEPGEDRTVDRPTQFAQHEGDMRMTSDAILFAPLVEDGADSLAWWSRPDSDVTVSEAQSYRNFGQGDDSEDDVGLTFSLTRVTTSSSQALAPTWFDNARMEISDVVWELSQDGVKWRQLFEIPGRKPVRVNFPDPANRVMARAISNNVTEWVQSVTLKPVFR